VCRLGVWTVREAGSGRSGQGSPAPTRIVRNVVPSASPRYVPLGSALSVTASERSDRSEAIAARSGSISTSVPSSRPGRPTTANTDAPAAAMDRTTPTTRRSSRAPPAVKRWRALPAAAMTPASDSASAVTGSSSSTSCAGWHPRSSTRYVAIRRPVAMTTSPRLVRIARLSRSSAGRSIRVRGPGSGEASNRAGSEA